MGLWLSTHRTQIVGRKWAGCVIRPVHHRLTSEGV